MDANANCNLCGKWVKSCPNDAIEIRIRKPTSELWFINNPKIEESFLAMAIMGIVLIQNLTKVGVWNDLLAWIARTTGVTNYALIFTAALVVAVSLPVALLAGASRLVARSNFEHLLLAAGIAASLYTARRIAHRRYSTAARRTATLRPDVAVICVLAALNVWMFALPMVHRM